VNGTVSVSVDIGGTFTDTVLRRGGEVFVEKTLTTHGDVLDGFFRGMGGAAGRAGITVDMIDGAVLHATTIVTNALIERKGTQAALLLTEGFTDILEIRDERRFDIYDTQIEFPKPLISRDLVFGVGERTLADGRIQNPVDPEEIASICDTLQARGIKSIAICLLHSYRNPTNEKQVAALIRERLPSALISVSSEVASQIREYLRASTTAVNAYTVPITKPYLDRLERRLERDRIESKPLIMLSSGGVVGSATAGANPVRMIESGPAAGALGAAYASKALGINTLLAFDMGGTTAKVCLIQDHQPLVTGHFEIDRIYRLKEGSGLPVAVPCIDMIEIGAGGGSIAHVNELGTLNVGPRSAGSEPGPACYGRGGAGCNRDRRRCDSRTDRSSQVLGRFDGLG
jgi:N-methylhydantoinase A